MPQRADRRRGGRARREGRQPISRAGRGAGEPALGRDRVLRLRPAVARRRGFAQDAAGRAAGGAAQDHRSKPARTSASPNTSRATAAEVFEQAVAAGAEGIVAKDRTAPYVSGRTHAFVKIKGYPRTDVVIVGYKPSTKSAAFRLAARRGRGGRQAALCRRHRHGLLPRSSARDIFAQDLARRLGEAAAEPRRRMAEGPEIPQDAAARGNPLRRLDRRRPFAPGALSGVARGSAREPPPAEAPPPAKAAPMRPMTITHADRVVYPDAGVTKGEIAAYYDAVAERMARICDDRPLSIVRAPETIAETFFQRHPLRGMETGHHPRRRRRRDLYGARRRRSACTPRRSSAPSSCTAG